MQAKSTLDTTASTNGHVVELRGVVKTYSSAAGVFSALRGVDLRVRAGEFVSVIGKSGSGKSTLINMIAGIDRPTQGEVIIDGTAVHTLSEEAMAIWRGRTVGVIFQFFQLLPSLTAVENILLAMDYGKRYPRSERAARAMELLSLVDMADQAHRFPAELSGGEQQRAAIARALANEPILVAADEPTGNLDSRSAMRVLEVFERLVTRGATVLMVTHDNDLAQLTQRTVLIVDGAIADDTVRRQP